MALVEGTQVGGNAVPRYTELTSNKSNHYLLSIKKNNEVTIKRICDQYRVTKEELAQANSKVKLLNAFSSFTPTGLQNRYYISTSNYIEDFYDTYRPFPVYTDQNVIYFDSVNLDWVKDHCIYSKLKYNNPVASPVFYTNLTVHFQAQGAVVSNAGVLMRWTQWNRSIDPRSQGYPKVGSSKDFQIDCLAWSYPNGYKTPQGTTDYTDLGDYIRSSELTDYLPQGDIYVPIKSQSGNTVDTTNPTNPKGDEGKVPVDGNGDSGGTTYDKFWTPATPLIDISSEKRLNLEGTPSDSYILIKSGDFQQGYYLPKHVYPPEVTDTTSASFTPTSILGRSVNYQTYQGSRRALSFSLDLHEDLNSDDPDYVHRLVRAIQAACYPSYSSGGGVNPPYITVKILKQFKIQGILSSAPASWETPVLDLSGYYSHCKLNLTVEEITGPFSASEVFSNKYVNRRG